jgi:hypothetical protein
VAASSFPHEPVSSNAEHASARAALKQSSVCWTVTGQFGGYECETQVAEFSTVRDNPMFGPDAHSNFVPAGESIEAVIRSHASVSCALLRFAHEQPSTEPLHDDDDLSSVQATSHNNGTATNRVFIEVSYG